MTCSTKINPKVFKVITNEGSPICLANYNSDEFLISEEDYVSLLNVLDGYVPQQIKELRDKYKTKMKDLINSVPKSLRVWKQTESEDYEDFLANIKHIPSALSMKKQLDDEFRKEFSNIFKNTHTDIQTKYWQENKPHRKFSKKTKQRIEETLSQLNNLGVLGISDDFICKKVGYIRFVQFRSERSKGQADNDIVSINSDSDPSTIAHEIGHVHEYNSSWLEHFSHALFAERANMTFYDVEKRKQFRFAIGKFNIHYMNKIYAGGGTELVSMYYGSLISDPYKLILNDEKTFDAITTAFYLKQVTREKQKRI